MKPLTMMQARHRRVSTRTSSRQSTALVVAVAGRPRARALGIWCASFAPVCSLQSKQATQLRRLHSGSSGPCFSAFFFFLLAIGVAFYILFTQYLQPIENNILTIEDAVTGTRMLWDINYLALSVDDVPASRQLGGPALLAAADNYRRIHKSIFEAIPDILVPLYIHRPVALTMWAASEAGEMPVSYAANSSYWEAGQLFADMGEALGNASLSLSVSDDLEFVPEWHFIVDNGQRDLAAGAFSVMQLQGDQNDALRAQFILLLSVCGGVVFGLLLLLLLAWYPLWRRTQNESSALVLLKDLPKSVVQEVYRSFPYVSVHEAQNANFNFTRKRERRSWLRGVAWGAVVFTMLLCAVVWARMFVKSNYKFGSTGQAQKLQSAYLSAEYFTRHLYSARTPEDIALRQGVALSELETLAQVETNMLLLFSTHTEEGRRYFESCDPFSPNPPPGLRQLLAEFRAAQAALVMSAPEALVNGTISDADLEVLIAATFPQGVPDSPVRRCVVELLHLEIENVREAIYEAVLVGTLVFWLFFPLSMALYYFALPVGLRNEIADDTLRCQTMFRQLPVAGVRNVGTVYDYMMRFGLAREQAPDAHVSVSRRNSLSADDQPPLLEVHVLHPEMCNNCGQQPASVRLLPCGHSGFCSGCGGHLKACPLSTCATPVQSVEVFAS
eukprot:TRINITY_DN2006_c0_g1_i2.p1 TRINITY_DN2006_c0_g1~~TRINITY_DN2006_c0_g1_i2.p1  ORF type:complete len:671 (-),score=132.18 TRINITY_DN2006_c0_g1_i2:70-2082(-)